jgi:hypothetical protein
MINIIEIFEQVGTGGAALPSLAEDPEGRRRREPGRHGPGALFGVPQQGFRLHGEDGGGFLGAPSFRGASSGMIQNIWLTPSGKLTYLLKIAICSGFTH